MKLFFDARYTRTDYHDGISRYSAELGNALAKLTPITFLISDEKQKKWFPQDASFIKIHNEASIKEPWTAMILNKYHPDVVYSPMQTIGTAGRNYKSVLTVHDLIYYHHRKAPSFLPLIIKAGWWLYHLTYLPQRLLLKGGDLITSVSQTSANQIKKARMTTKPIHVIYNAPQQFSHYPVRLDTIKNIVYMGSFMPYKNTEMLIEGMRWLPGRTLHVLSRINPKRQAELTALIPEGASVTFHNGVSDDEYEKILADNAVLATASLDEGFGIPVAEAMAMGVPVVVSDIAVFREIGGDGASYFEPKNPQAFADAVKKLDDKSYRDAQLKRASAYVQKFDWNESAKALLAAIKTLF